MSFQSTLFSTPTCDGTAMFEHPRTCDHAPACDQAPACDHADTPLLAILESCTCHEHAADEGAEIDRIAPLRLESC